MTFKDLELSPAILNAIDKLGFITPSEIQQQAIPVLTAGQQDFIGLAQTGTGKTAAFGLPLMQHVNFNNKHTQALVICPTRELCMQITKDLAGFAQFQEQVNIVAVYGGARIDKQISSLKKGAQIVVATPGRLIDLIKRKAVKLQTVDRVVLDEADEMLNMGFKEDIDAILEQTPQNKRVWLFSATMPKAVRQIAQNYMDNPKELVIGQKNSSPQNITHQFVMMKERDRYQALKRILDYYPDIFGLIFCRTRRETGQIADKLEREGYDVVALHGELSQSQRDAAMKKFRDKTVRILVATDVAARGIDVDNISHVIHYNLADDAENYTHRSGRTARAGKSGISIALINTREKSKVSQIEKAANIRFEPTQIPDAEAICEKQMYALMDKVIQTEVDQEAIERYWPVIYEKLNNIPLEDIIMKFISTEINSFLNYYKNSNDLNAKQETFKESRKQRTKGKNNDFSNTQNQTRLNINLGQQQNMNKGALLRLVCDQTGISGKQIGPITIHAGLSIFDVDTNVKDNILNNMKTGNYEGKPFMVKLDDGPPKKQKKYRKNTRR